MTYSLNEQTGLSLKWEDPLWFPDRLRWGNFSNELAAYSHTLGADWGFLSATITLRLRELEAYDWILNGLGRDIRVYDSQMDVVFRGFVDKISYDQGGATHSRGPISEIANRAYCVYTPLYILDKFISPSGQTELPAIEDTASQALYAIWEKVVNAGQCVIIPGSTYNEAAITQASYLMQFKEPPKVVGISGGGSGQDITLEITGYYKFLSAYLYQNRLYSGVPTAVTYTSHLTTVLAANINTSVISASTAFIEANANLIIDKEESYRQAIDIIQAILNGGGTTGERWLFYLDAENIIHYGQAPVLATYTWHGVDQRGEIYFTGAPANSTPGASVLPWKIQAGKVIFTGDNVAYNSEPPGTLDTDTRLALISQVRYTAPWGWDITTEKLNRFQSWLNKKGLGAY